MSKPDWHPITGADLEVLRAELRATLGDATADRLRAAREAIVTRDGKREHVTDMRFEVRS